jgi:hypothetical protein
MSKQTIDVLQQLSDANPVDAATTTRMAGEQVRDRLLAHVTAQPRARRRGRERLAPRRRRPMTLALAAAAAATAIVVTLGLLPGGTPGSPPAAVALELAARAAATRPYTEPGPNQRWYQQVRMRITAVNEDTTTELVVHERWTARDGRTWIRESRPDGRELTPRTRLEETRWAHTTAKLSPDELRTLPTDPAAMRDRMEALAARHLPTDHRYLPSPAVFVAFTCLTNPAVRPAQRAALFRMVASIPGVQTLDATKDGAGHPGTAILVSSETADPPTATREVWTFDPNTSQITALHSKAYLGSGKQRRLALEQDWTFEDVQIVPAPED